jgi:naringenin degradation protein FdeH
MKPNSVRRVVTGHDEAGKAIVVSDGTPPVIIRSEVQTGLSFYEIWNTTEMPARIGEDCDEPTLNHSKTSPPAGGTIIRVLDLPPEGPNGPEFSKEQAEKIFSAVGLEENTDHVQPGRHPLMHRTQSVDYGIVLSGEIVLLLDDSEVVLGPGDVVVQRGTIHAWTNRTDDIARIAFVLTDGKFDADLSAKQSQFDALPS